MGLVKLLSLSLLLSLGASHPTLSSSSTTTPVSVCTPATVTVYTTIGGPGPGEGSGSSAGYPSGSVSSYSSGSGSGPGEGAGYPSGSVSGSSSGSVVGAGYPSGSASSYGSGSGYPSGSVTGYSSGSIGGGYPSSSVSGYSQSSGSGSSSGSVSGGSPTSSSSSPSSSPTKGSGGGPGTGHGKNDTHPCVNGPNSRQCWGDFDINTDYDTTYPHTGKIVEYYLEIDNGTASPDGFERQVLTVNGQIPGPTIEANWGDTLKITVKNNLKNNGTSIHWHGLRQLNTNDQDGANGITECPLAPGDTKTYQFQATYYGSSWYHSHFSVQYGDGVIGAIVIHGPASANYDEDLGPIVIQDWFHSTTFQKEYEALHEGPPAADNYLLNGINEAVDGKSGSRFKLAFEKGKKYLLRLINTSTDNFFKVHLDGHKFTVISTDFVPITPYETEWVPLGVGQRYDVIVEADQAVDNYFLRAVVQFSCANNTNTGLGTSNGIVSYKGAGSGLPTSTAGSFTDDCADPPASSLVPIVSESVDSSTFSAKESSLPVGGPTPSVQTYGNVITWSLNGEPIDIDWTNPTLLQVQNGATTFSASQNVIRLDQANVWTFWVIQNTFPQAHPMHLHGHQFNVLGSGNGTFDGSASSLNFQNPGRRDTVMLPALGWTTIAFQTDNPGAWLLHCHIGWHVGAGLSLQFLERESDIPETFTLGSDFKKTCDNWDKYYNGPTAYNKTDSGLRRL